MFSSSNAYPDIDARIAGITKITSKFPDSKQYLRHVITFVLSFLLLIFYSKQGRLAFSKRNYSSNLSIRIGNGVLSIVCAFSSVLLLKSVIDIENYKTLVFSLIVIPISLGILWAWKEQKYEEWGRA